MADGKVGRPSEFSQEIADTFCEHIMLGESVRQICLLEEMPDERTIYRWLAKYEDFCQQYARAKEVQADRFSEELIDISDDGRNDWEERENSRTGQTYIALNEEAISRSKLRVETRKWLMGKMKPKKYGDKVQQEVSGPNGGPVSTEVKHRITFVSPPERNEDN